MKLLHELLIHTQHGATVAEVKTTTVNSIQDNIGLLYGAAVQK